MELIHSSQNLQNKISRAQRGIFNEKMTKEVETKFSREGEITQISYEFIITSSSCLTCVLTF